MLCKGSGSGVDSPCRGRPLTRPDPALEADSATLPLVWVGNLCYDQRLVSLDDGDTSP
jgi:hypothetical protein